MTATATAPRTGLCAQIAAAREHNASQALKLVTFCIGGEEYGVDIMAVREINRMTEFTRVPQSPKDVEGVINLRGRIVPVIDLRKRFGMPPSERTESSRVMVVEVGGRVLGFIVDRVSQAGLEVQSGVVDPPPAMACSIDADYLAGVAKLQDRLVILLDLEKLFENHVAGKAA
jgi:purine-binding chemotaxis protein CheW